MRRLIVMIALVACAQPGFPPGGPERKLPPKLLAVAPESGAVNVKAKEVVLKFDEVLSENPSGGASDLSQLVLISPSDGDPRVGWHRSELSIRGRHDWLPNTAYTVTLLPGLADLRGNVRKVGTTLVFSTGPTIPQSRIAGIVFDWSTGRPLPNAMINAIRRPDSTLYLARTDSSGRFEVPYLPAADYTVRGWNDGNNNRQLDVREGWDSVHIALRDSARVELLAFIHDTIGPRVDQVSILDSLTLRVHFDKPLDTGQRIDSSLFRLQRSDSTVVPLARVEPASVYDSARAAAQAHADSLRARTDTGRARLDSLRRQAAAQVARVGRGLAADTTKRKAEPRPSKPIPVSEVVIILTNPLPPGTSYRLEARGARNLLGYAATTSHLFNVPKPEAPAANAKKLPAARPDTARRPRRP